MAIELWEVHFSGPQHMITFESKYDDGGMPDPISSNRAISFHMMEIKEGFWVGFLRAMSCIFNVGFHLPFILSSVVLLSLEESKYLQNYVLEVLKNDKVGVS